MQPVAVEHPLLVASRQAVPVPVTQQAVPPVVQAFPRAVQESQLQEADVVVQVAPLVA